MPIEPRIRVSAILRREDSILLCRHEKHGNAYWIWALTGMAARIRAVMAR